MAMARPHLGWTHPWSDDDLPDRADLAELHTAPQRPVPARIRALVGDDPRTPGAMPPSPYQQGDDAVTEPRVAVEPAVKGDQ